MNRCQLCQCQWVLLILSRNHPSSSIIGPPSVFLSIQPKNHKTPPRRPWPDPESTTEPFTSQKPSTDQHRRNRLRVYLLTVTGMDMEYAPTPTAALFFPPPFPTSPKAVDLSPLEFILALLAIITIPILIYAFFFTIKFPGFSRRSSGRFSHDSGARGGTGEEDTLSGLKFKKDADAHIGGECPVCLSTFVEGEEIRQLSACKHAFHTSCIDPWLSSHSNCPICRAVVVVKLQSSTTSAAAARTRGGGDTDHHQGLPDAAFLV